MTSHSKPPITIIDACLDPQIFGPWFRDRQSWAAWFCFLKVMFGLPLDEAELELFKSCTGRDSPNVAGYLFATLVIGRRGGKSLVMALIAAFLGCFYDWSPYLTGGERATIVIVAADRKQAGVIFKYLRGMLGIPLLAGMIERETLDTIELNNSVTIEIQTASWRSIRGRTVAVALCDEAAFWQSDDSANPDTEIIAALKPAMATIPMARMLIASSPYSRKGILWADYERHYGRNDSPTLVWQADTRTMNPSVPESFVAQAYEDDAASAGAEYGAQFRTDVETLFSREAIAAVTVASRLELPKAPSANCVAFCDPSGGSADSMTIAVAHVEGGVVVLDAVRERRPPFSPEDVVEEFCALLKAYGVRRVKGDRYGGMWPREQFSKRGIHYETSEKTTSDLYLEFLPMVNAGSVQLLDHKRLLAQLISLERRTSRTNKDTVSHPPHGHDDIATSVAGVMVNALGSSRNTTRVVSLDHFFRWGFAPAPTDEEDNYKAAEKAFEHRQLSGRDLMWFKCERERRRKAGLE
ncbi:hypothetical protein [Bradyrhizobium sp. Cp5.3]|uniref:hypothetical protein n=1 Tax=Bradyrhizobium sp. Cp5.3 TaxID=443598 RepID=UPI0003FB4F79|nr:hypothetical protein [Bradyrhizobium sp. Cp5.3]